MATQLLLTAAAAPCGRRKQPALLQQQQQQLPVHATPAPAGAPGHHRLMMRRSSVDWDGFGSAPSVISCSSISSNSRRTFEFAERPAWVDAGGQLLKPLDGNTRPALWRRRRRRTSSSSSILEDLSSEEFNHSISSNISFGCALSRSGSSCSLGSLGGAIELGLALHALLAETDGNSSSGVGANCSQEILLEDQDTVVELVEDDTAPAETGSPLLPTIGASSGPRTRLVLGKTVDVSTLQPMAHRMQGAKKASAAPLRFSSLRARPSNVLPGAGSAAGSKPQMRLLLLPEASSMTSFRPVSPPLFFADGALSVREHRAAFFSTQTQHEPEITPASPVAVAPSSLFLSAPGSGSVAANSSSCHIEFLEVEGVLVGKLLTRPDGSSGCYYDAGAELAEEAAGATYGLTPMTAEEWSLQQWAHVRGLRWEDLRTDDPWAVTVTMTAAAADDGDGNDDNTNESGSSPEPSEGAKAGRCRSICGSVATAAAKIAKAAAWSVFRMVRARMPAKQRLDRQTKAAVRELLRLRD